MASKRYLVSLNEAQQNALGTLMAEALMTSPSAYMASLITEAWKGRGKKAGRPKGSAKQADVDEDEEPRDIPHPDTFGHAGEMITATELEAWQHLRGSAG